MNETVDLCYRAVFPKESAAGEVHIRMNLERFGLCRWVNAIYRKVEEPVLLFAKSRGKTFSGDKSWWVASPKGAWYGALTGRWLTSQEQTQPAPGSPFLRTMR
jgi:hypothetical protein